MKANMEAMKDMMALVKKDTNNQNQNKGNSGKKAEKKKAREEHQKRYNEATICKHCGNKHPYTKEDECWALKANAASHPSNWKPNK
jgi:ribosomal protein L19E